MTGTRPIAICAGVTSLSNGFGVLDASGSEVRPTGGMP
jgi:hypothetical protein